MTADVIIPRGRLGHVYSDGQAPPNYTIEVDTLTIVGIPPGRWDFFTSWVVDGSMSAVCEFRLECETQGEKEVNVLEGWGEPGKMA